MRVGICSVGAELVSGDVADGNAHWLAQRLNESGCAVPAIVVTGDEIEQLTGVLRWLGERCDVLVVGGGLGPTVDDLTRDAVSRFAGRGLERRSELVEHLEAVYQRLARPMPADALRQADVPGGAEVHAPKGTAAGFSLDVPRESGALRVHVLPGVPWEYRELAERAVLPDIVRRSGGAARITRILHVAGLGESGVGAVLRPLTDRLAEEQAGGQRVDVGFLANEGEVLVKISATGPDPKTARELAEPAVQEAIARLGEALTSVDDATVADEVARLLGTLGLTLAAAETFTGGHLASAMAGAPAGIVRGALVAPTVAGLLDLLGPGAAYDGTGAGAEGPGAIAAQLARAVRRHTDADVAIATVGVLDEGDATASHPAGTAVWAVAGPDEDDPLVEDRFIPAADRGLVQVRGAAFALESLRRRLLAHRQSTVPAAVAP